MLNTEYNEYIKKNDSFKLPIFYNEEKMEFKANIINDLELIKTIDASCNPIYNQVFNPESIISKNVMDQMPNYYTTDVYYLKQTQELLKTYQPLLNADVTNNEDSILKPDYDEFYNLWLEIKGDTGFKDKYYYIDWPVWEFLNNSEGFLQFMSMYNMSSPIFSLFVPIIILIIPFFIIKFKGLNLTISEYFEVLKVLAANHAIGRIFTHFNTVSFDQKIYLLISAGFYLFSIYQNVLTCIKFHENMKKIHKYLSKVKHYLNHSINNMIHFLNHSNKFDKYRLFNQEVERNIEILNKYRNTFNFTEEYHLNFMMVSEIGRVLKCFYQLYDDKSYHSAFVYSFGFNGYIENIENLIVNIKEKHIHFTQFTEKKNKNIFKKSYYGALKGNNPVKNTVKLSKNLIVTGPNASGKTTILKSTLINILLSQQFGCGFYDKAILKPYKHIHCYLNIPDTSGRDSLFQAEARRCKEILDIIKEAKDEQHFCVFDELYSGTNPDEAVNSAFAFMEYLTKNKNVNSILTTHFLKVCKELNKNASFINYHMETKYNKEKNNLIYTYIFKKGISEVKGGIKVLKDMNYPKELLDSITK